jgi:NAD-dependent deacetylase
MKKHIRDAAKLILKAKYPSAFTGAGISKESGIPTFRGEDGLWAKYDPDLFHISYFTSNPAESWKLLKELFFETFAESKPNEAHNVLARFEESGLIKALITQNIDNLHFEAGSRNIAEYHGACRNLVCLKCRKIIRATDEILEKLPPVCGCGGLLKPDIVFFGEEIPEKAVIKAQDTVERTDLMIVVGTTGEIYPASFIPIDANSRGATIIEVNTKPSRYTYVITEIFLQGKASSVLKDLEHEINHLLT